MWWRQGWEEQANFRLIWHFGHSCMWPDIDFSGEVHRGDIWIWDLGTLVVFLSSKGLSHTPSTVIPCVTCASVARLAVLIGEWGFLKTVRWPLREHCFPAGGYVTFFAKKLVCSPVAGWHASEYSGVRVICYFTIALHAA